MARRRVRARGARPRYDWGRIVEHNAFALTGNDEATVPMVSFAPSFVGGETLRRTRGILTLDNSTGLDIGNVQFVMAAYVTRDGSEAVAGAVPIVTSSADASDDYWMMWSPVPIMWRGDQGGSDQTRWLLEFDVKAMRKVPAGRLVSYVLGYKTLAAVTDAIRWRLEISALGSELRT